MGRRLIADSNLLIAYERGDLERTPFDDDDVAVAAVSIAEFRVGAELADSPTRRADRVASLDELLEFIAVLAYTDATAVPHGRLLAHVRRSGRPRERHDLIIAAHAVETGRTLITHDAAARFGDLPRVTAISPA